MSNTNTSTRMTWEELTGRIESLANGIYLATRGDELALATYGDLEALRKSASELHRLLVKLDKQEWA